MTKNVHICTKCEKSDEIEYAAHIEEWYCDRCVLAASVVKEYNVPKL